MAHRRTCTGQREMRSSPRTNEDALKGNRGPTMTRGRRGLSLGTPRQTGHRHPKLVKRRRQIAHQHKKRNRRNELIVKSCSCTSRKEKLNERELSLSFLIQVQARVHSHIKGIEIRRRATDIPSDGRVYFALQTEGPPQKTCERLFSSLPA
jgi:hypothetical protein